MAAYLNGNQKAFQQLFARLAPRVHGFFMRSFRDSAVADELLQNTFLKMHQSRHTFRAGAPVRPWLFTIAASARADELRRRRRIPEDVEEDPLARAEMPNELAASDRASADEREIVAQVRAALERLSEPQRIVVHLHRYEGMTFGEIAVVLGSTEGAVKLRAFRAYEELRNDLSATLRPDHKS